MATLTLTWDNTAVNASANATGQRAMKRIAAIGGAFNSSNFSPANPLLKTATTTQAESIIANRVYDFYIEALCTEGGPTPNTDGIKQRIKFECITPVINTGIDYVTVIVNVANTDITKGRFILRKQSDDTIVDTVVGTRSGFDEVFATFPSLSPDAYYVTVEFYAVVDGVEVISSAAGYMNAVCGGNEEGYQADITLETATVLVNNTSGSGTIEAFDPYWFFTIEGSIPTGPGNTAEGGHGGFTGNFGVQITGGFGTALKLFINAVEVDCLAISADGIYTFVGVTIDPADAVEIRLSDGGC